MYQRKTPTVDSGEVGVFKNTIYETAIIRSATFGSLSCHITDNQIYKFKTFYRAFTKIARKIILTKYCNYFISNQIEDSYFYLGIAGFIMEEMKMIDINIKTKNYTMWTVMKLI